ncbi:hypothetical protein NEOLEDRAFT_801845 [Neolentinus lepideus HHB14362 ss-1]|uniref:Uncharacterized protein n=1 Tax=Neolentinus lepideus HHB14362 ss-1 TaxID=1314782 RepID=A0A165PI53_9AGAM|nr:hypothetical protein NEOLEDRAFT_801845 [Neolentinus lepideus HHB14362 ss-1]
MPHILQGSPPDIATLYCTHRLEPSTVDTLKSDFALAAHDQYEPLVKLRVSDRADLQDYSPEEIRRQLEREGQEDGVEMRDFLIADEQTSRDDTVIYASRWASRDDFFGEDNLVESPDWPKEGQLPFVHKLRIHMHYALVLWVNLSICNITIPELYEYPFDPNKPMTVYDDGNDWRKEPPPLAYISASPRSYVTSDDPEDTAKFMPTPDRIYKLTDEAAEQLGVVPRWAPGWHAPEEPKGHIRFGQYWKTD